MSGAGDLTILGDTTSSTATANLEDLLYLCVTNDGLTGKWIE